MVTRWITEHNLLFRDAHHHLLDRMLTQVVGVRHERSRPSQLPLLTPRLPDAFRLENREQIRAKGRYTLAEIPSHISVWQCSSGFE